MRQMQTRQWTPEQVIEMRRLFRAEVPCTELVKSFGGTQSTVWRAVRGFTYADVPGFVTRAEARRVNVKMVSARMQKNTNARRRGAKSIVQADLTARRSRVIAQMWSGHTVRDIASELEVTPDAVLRLAKKIGFESRPVSCLPGETRKAYRPPHQRVKECR